MIIIIYFYNYYYQSNSVYKQQFHLIFADGPPWIIIGAAAGGGAVSLLAIIVLLICCLRRDKKGEQFKICQPRLSLHREAQLTKRYNNLALKNTWLRTYHKRLQNPLTNFKSPLVVISSFKSERKLIFLVQIANVQIDNFLSFYPHRFLNLLT